jgi:hypothetical protein
MRPAAELAAQIAGTEFVPKGMRDNPAAIAACVLYGDEVGLGPMQALAKIAVIDGRPTLAAEAMRSLIFAAGHEVWVDEASTVKAVVAGRRAESSNVTRVTWSIEDAKRANLAGKANWRLYPRQMLLARATAELARLIFADAIGGLSATEELEILTDSLEPEAAEGARPRGRARRRESTTLVPVPDEAPAAADADTEELSEPQRRKLHAMFRERGADRHERLKWASQVLGREVESFTDLTRLEGTSLIERLNADDIPFGLPEPEPTGAPGEAASPSPAAEPEAPLPTEETPAAPVETPAAPIPPESEPEPLSVVMFRARFTHEGFTVEDVAEAGHALYPGRSLGDLEDAERGALLEHLVAERGLVEE